MDYYSLGYSQYGDHNTYRGDVYQNAHMTGQAENSAIATYPQAALAQVPTPVPQLQNVPNVVHQRPQVSNAPANPVRMTNMQHLYQQKGNQSQALGTQNYHQQQQQWGWQDYQQGVEMNVNSLAQQQQQRMKNAKQLGVQRFQFNQNFPQQPQNPLPLQTWTNPVNTNLNESANHPTSQPVSQVHQPQMLPQQRRPQPMYYPLPQTGVPPADYNTHQKNAKHHSKHEYPKNQFWQNPPPNPIPQKNRAWTNGVYQQAAVLPPARPAGFHDDPNPQDNRRMMGYLEEHNQQLKHGNMATPTGPTYLRHKSEKFRYPSRVPGPTPHKDGCYPSTSAALPPQPQARYIDPQQQRPNVNPTMPPFPTYNQPPNPYYYPGNVPQFNTAQQDRTPTYDRQRPVDGKVSCPVPGNTDYRHQPPSAHNPTLNQRARPFQKINQTLQPKQPHLNQRSNTFKRQQNDRNRRNIQMQKRRKAEVKNSKGIFRNSSGHYDNKKPQDRAGHAKMRFTVEDGLEAYFKNSFLDDPWSHLTPEETPIF